MPVLALFCEHDVNVLPTTNVPAMRKAFERSGNPNTRIIEFPGLNHIFQHTEAEAGMNYAQIEETFSPEVLEIVGDWIEAQAQAQSKKDG